MERLAVSAFALLLLFVGQDVKAFQTGAPNATTICKSLQPRHRENPFQTGPSSFLLEPEEGTVEPGKPVNIKITSRHGFFFKGFMMQGRTADTQEPLGTFTVDPSIAKTLECFGQSDNTVTHINPAPKNLAIFEWTPPLDFRGPVIFNATVVEDFANFWNINTRVLVGDPVGISTTRAPVTTRRTSTTTAPITQRPTPTNYYENPIYTGCGVSKACFGFPAKCRETKTCDALVTVSVRGSKYVFELSSSSGGYVAVGLSDDASMGDDSVMECVVVGNRIGLYQSWNKDKKNIRINNTGLQLKNFSFIDNNIYCQFERDERTIVEMEGKTKEFDLLKNKYFLLLAKGDAEGDQISYHGAMRAASGESGYLGDVAAFGSLASKLLFRLHGAFMIFSWIGAASIGIVLARYFKQTWTGSQMCGKDQWFAWHRLLMVLVWSLTIAAFVLIFVQLKGWSYGSDGTSISAHAILGIITTALAFFQPIGALFRPSPDSRRRPVFNWLHWCFGNSAHILGIVTIFLAGELSTAELPIWWIWIMVGYVVFHVLMHLVFSVAGCISERQSGTRINSFPMKEMSNSRSPLASAERKQEAPHSCFRKFLLAVYILGVLALTIALIVIAVLAPIEENFEHFKKLISNSSE